MWYYSTNGERLGPVSVFAIRSLYEQKAIDAETPVWQEGMEGWQPLHSTGLAGDLRVPLPDGDGWEKCSFSGDVCRRSEMVQIDGYWVGNEHKDNAVEVIKQGGRLPVATIDSPYTGNLELSHLLRSSWALLAPCLPSALAIYIAVWIPGNLVINYVDVHFLADAPAFRVYQFANTVQSLWGNLATGGILYLLCQQILGRATDLGSAVNAAFANWGRLWVASFLAGLMTILGVLLLIIPGFIVITRTAFMNAAAVDGQMSGSSAVQDSWNVTKGHGWRVFGCMLLVGMMTASPNVVFVSVSGLVPFLDHWAVNAVVGTAFELPMIYLLAFGLVFYRELKALQPDQKR